MDAIRNFKVKYPDMYEFIMFNLLSNVATITNFVVLAICMSVLFKSFSSIPFHWFIFDYAPENGGLGGFLSFLLAYVIAQIVNFIVQRKYVFDSNVSVKKVIHWYILTVTVAGIISIWLPPYIIQFLTPYVGGFATVIANIVNIVVQVVINYPMMKFKIMKRDD
ncbi:GtrA family protein [Erysipelothrix anatis]|uniref:GtrA family protein n=1 Tax=Erysipelothrix anatis TaxID=2683713 RepID=UPI001359B51B|nr:GtrA family protein [Erysipelothrix anatis]